MMGQNLLQCLLSSFAVNPNFCNEYPVNDNLTAFLFLFSLSFSDFILHIHCECRRLFLHLITLNDKYTHTLSGTPLDEGSARRKDLYLTTRNNHKRQTFMPPEGIEPAIPASERPHTHALDLAATGIGTNLIIRISLFIEKR